MYYSRFYLIKKIPGRTVGRYNGQGGQVPTLTLFQSEGRLNKLIPSKIFVIPAALLLRVQALLL